MPPALFIPYWMHPSPGVAPDTPIPCWAQTGDARAHLCMTLPFWKALKPSR